MRPILLAALIMFASLAAHGQSREKNEYRPDTSYVKVFEERFSVSAFIAQEVIELAHSPLGDSECSYMPNNPPKLGLGFSINNTIVGFSYGYGLRFLGNKNRGKTRSFDLRINHYGRKFAVDLFILRYKGFYMDEPEFKLCPDLAVSQIGVHGDYILNHRKFSYRAAYNQSERQLRSAGSFLVGAGAHITRIKSDTSLVIGGRNSFRTFQAGISGGYTHSWKIGRRWYANLSLSLGVYFGQGIRSSGDREYGVFPSLLQRAAFGYNARTWSVGFSYVGNFSMTSISESTPTSLHSAGFKISVAKRFGAK